MLQGLYREGFVSQNAMAGERGNITLCCALRRGLECGGEGSSAAESREKLFRCGTTVRCVVYIFDNSARFSREAKRMVEVRAGLSQRKKFAGRVCLSVLPASSACRFCLPRLSAVPICFVCLSAIFVSW